MGSDLDVSITAVLPATVVQFVVGAVWYMPLFGKLWGEMFGFDKLSKKEQQALQSKMGPFYGLQLFVTLLTSFVLAHFIAAFPEYSAYKLAAWIWLGFVVPTQVSAVVFGGVESKWIPRRLGIMAGGSLACLTAAAWVLS
jgi:hypothetical protein